MGRAFDAFIRLVYFIVSLIGAFMFVVFFSTNIDLAALDVPDQALLDFYIDNVCDLRMHGDILKIDTCGTGGEFQVDTETGLSSTVLDSLAIGEQIEIGYFESANGTKHAFHISNGSGMILLEYSQARKNFQMSEIVMLILSFIFLAGSFFGGKIAIFGFAHGKSPRV